MANDQHLMIIGDGWERWNQWRSLHPDEVPNLSGADLSETDLREADLRHAELTGANMIGADLRSADLSYAILTHANLSDASLNHGAILDYANLTGALLVKTDLSGASLIQTNLNSINLSEAILREANLMFANLEGKSLLMRANPSGANLGGASLDGAMLLEANLSGASFVDAILTSCDLVNTDLTEAILAGADFSESQIGGTTFASNDLSTVKGLETLQHLGPSSVGVDTLYMSDGRIPDSFLRDAGVPDDFITFLPSLIGRAIEFYSCFISYSHEDEGFSRRLHSRLRSEKLRVWYAPEDMKGGDKLHEQIFRAIQIHEKLLLVLSEKSMNSEWVMTEIRRAKKIETDEKRRKLFPLRLVDMEAIKKWECFDADIGKDLAVEVREYYIPDFTDWKNHDAFETEFEKLLRALRSE